MSRHEGTVTTNNGAVSSLLKSSVIDVVIVMADEKTCKFLTGNTNAVKSSSTDMIYNF